MCMNLSRRQIDYFHFYAHVGNGFSVIAPGQNCPVEQFFLSDMTPVDGSAVAAGMQNY